MVRGAKAIENVTKGGAVLYPAGLGMMPSPVEGGRLVAVLLGCALLAGTGGAGGIGLAAGHYRPLLDQANEKAATCVAARDNLSGLAE